MGQRIRSLFNNYKVLLQKNLTARIITFLLIGIIVGVPIVAITINKNNQQKYYNIQFDTSGGTYIEPITIKEGETISPPISPIKKGFNFIEWQYENSKYDFNKPVNSDMTITAIWEKEEGIETVIITFDTSGGTKIQSIEVIKGGTIEKPNEPQMPGYKFEGWYDGQEKFNFSTPINKNITLKAKWINKNEQSVGNQNMSTSNNEKYECTGAFRSDIPEKNVQVGYSDHVNWTWSTNGAHGTEDVCYITYKTSNEEVATVNDNGIITTIKAGTTYISECINDVKTKDEVLCFKGKLNVISKNDNTTVLNKYDEIVNKYVGIWYLEGYKDIFITITKYKMYYEAMMVDPLNVNIENGELYPLSYGGPAIAYSDWDNNLEKYGIKLGTNKITIKTSSKTLTFIKQQGTKTKYDNTTFIKSLGTWYLFNKPDSSIKIYSSGGEEDPRNNPFYCIESNHFEIMTFDYNSSGEYGCEVWNNEDLFNKYGISISNDKLTINNGIQSKEFYKTKKIVSVTGIELNKTDLNLFIGNSETLVATIKPDDAYNKSYSWSSSNPTVATVDNSGKVVAVSEGTTTITVTANDGNYSSKCNVIVSRIAVTGVTLNKTELTLIKGNNTMLSATISPSNATNKNLIWKSDNTNIVSVDNNGKVTAKGIGTAIITVATEDGNFSKECTITVKYPELIVDPSIGYSIITSNSSIKAGISVSLDVSGGSGSYTYYYIKLYKNGVLIAESATNELLVTGHKNGSYYIEYTVRDSAGNEKVGKSGITTISM